MADGTQGGNSSGPDKIWTEDVGSASGKIPRSKIALGALDVDGGDLAAGQGLAAASLPVVICSDQTVIPVGGNVASDGVDAGNPVKIGGKANSTLPAAVGAGDRVDAAYTLKGQAWVAAVSGNLSGNNGLGIPQALNRTDDSNSGTIGAAPILFNGSNYDLQRSNNEQTVLASAARTTNTNSADQTNYNSRGIVVTVDCTANTSAAGITVAIKYKDTLSGKYVALLTSAALFAASATGTQQLTVFPGATVAANVAASMPVPRLWRVEVTHGDASSITYSVSANYIN